MNRPVLLTGARAPVAIELARAFAAAGYPVWLGDSVGAHAARLSPWGGRLLRLPPARHAFGAYGEALVQWLDAHPGGLIVPSCEEVFYLAEAAARRDFAAQLFAPEPAVLQRLHSKIEFPAWVRSLGIAAPETWAVDAPAQALAFGAEAEAEVEARGGLVFKPEFSRFGSRTLIRPGPRVLQRLDASPACRWAAQPFVAGEEICLWAAVREGCIVASVAYRPAWRLGRSASFAFEAFDCPAALEVARTVASAAALTGQIAFDIVMRPDGVASPIECNPRAISGVHLFGGDAALARALTGEGPPVHRTRGLAYLGPAMLLLGLPRAIGRLEARRWWRDMRRGSEVLRAAGGMPVVFGALADAAGFAGRALVSGRGPASATTDDIEWNGEPIA
jgi:hypothetical protein